MERVVIGLDTSCYTTSAAAVTVDGRVVASCRKLLPVKEGERGLRQSEAVFIHVRQLPGRLEELAQHYEYIVLDLPPVTAVSDAVAISKLLDGVVIVVREGVTQRKGLGETMRQLKLAGVRILGFLYRGESEGKPYRRR